jgi:hypothetical protein
MINCFARRGFSVESHPVMEEVMCPSCGERFLVAVPARSECPAVLDYDCEVCCRPLLLVVDDEGRVEARGTGN